MHSNYHIKFTFISNSATLKKYTFSQHNLIIYIIQISVIVGFFEEVCIYFSQRALAHTWGGGAEVEEQRVLSRPCAECRADLGLTLRTLRP